MNGNYIVKSTHILLHSSILSLVSNKYATNNRALIVNVKTFKWKNILLFRLLQLHWGEQIEREYHPQSLWEIASHTVMCACVLRRNYMR